MYIEIEFKSKGVGEFRGWRVMVLDWFCFRRQEAVKDKRLKT